MHMNRKAMHCSLLNSSNTFYHTCAHAHFRFLQLQIFVFVTGEYSTPTNPLNQVILWDKIIERPEDAKLNLKKVHVKYGLIDQGEELRGANVTLRLYWDHMPLTGRLYTHDKPMESFLVPTEYGSFP
jgi:signal peptidase complex subunit 3